VVSAQQVTPVFVVPTDPVTAGSPVSIWLAVLNASDRAAPYSFPATLNGRLRMGGTEHAVSAALRDVAAGGDVVVPPGGYVRREYVLTVPAELQGQVVFSVPGLAANAVGFEAQKTERIAKTEDVPRREPLSEPVTKSDEPGPVDFFKKHFFGYEPLYFIAGTESPNAKFQISFKYQILNQDGWLAKRFPALTGLHLAYTQTSLWDWGAASAPFLDSSYKPEAFYAMEPVPRGRWADWFRLDLQGGVQHESNGKAGQDSRSLNIAYVQPTVVFGTADGFQFTLAPRVWTYLGSLSDNADLKDYRGYQSVRATLGWAKGPQLSALGRLGDDANRGSIQLDLSYPMMWFFDRSFSLYLHAQYFYGYGESLLQYNERGSAFRLGFSLYR
jgi:outer membrane phospholipase A